MGSWRTSALRGGLVALCMTLWPLPSWLVAQAAPAGVPPSSEQYSESLEVTVVEVPVRVLVKGQPVAGLTRQDFEVYDEGVLQPITAFESRVLARVEESTASRLLLEDQAAGRRLLVLFDFSSTRRQYLARALNAARKMVSSQLHPLDRVAIATYGKYSGLVLLVGFTRDLDQLTAALDLVGAILEADRKSQRSIIEKLNQLRFGAPDLVDNTSPGVFEALASELGETAALSLLIPEVAVVVRTQGGASVPELTERGGAVSAYRKEVRWVQIAAREPVDLTPQFAGGLDLSNLRAMSRSLAELFTLLREVKGEKQFVLLSEGFDNLLLSDALALGYLQELLRGLRNSGWTVYAVDVKGIPEARQAGYSADALLYLAKETGGELQENFNDLSQATARVLRRSGASYVLSFQPQNLERDGAYHTIEVKLRQPVRGAKIFHRPGYYAPEPTRQRPLSEWRVDAAEMVLTAEEVEELGVNTLAAPLSVEEERWRVPVVVELPWADLSPERKRGRDKSALEVQAFAIDADWQIRGFFAGGFQLDLGILEAHLAEGGVRFLGELSLPPGDFQLRTLVRNLRSGEVFVSTTQLLVPGIANRSHHVGAPLFVDDSGRWLLLTGASSGGSGRADFLIAGEGRFMPLVEPTLVAGSEVSILVPARGSVGARMALEARILDDAGEVVKVGEVRWHQPLLAGAGGIRWIPGTISTEGMAAGGYRLEITASWGEMASHQTAVSGFSIDEWTSNSRSTSTD